MSVSKLLDLLRAKQVERLAADVVVREYSQTPPVPPADDLQRRRAFIAPTTTTLPAYRAHFDAKVEAEADNGKSTENNSAVDRQAQRIRILAALVTADELLAAYRKIKLTLQRELSELDLHELALILANVDKREKSRTSGAYRSEGE